MTTLQQEIRKLQNLIDNIKMSDAPLDIKESALADTIAKLNELTAPSRALQDFQNASASLDDANFNETID